MKRHVDNTVEYAKRRPFTFAALVAAIPVMLLTLASAESFAVRWFGLDQIKDVQKIMSHQISQIKADVVVQAQKRNAADTKIKDEVEKLKRGQTRIETKQQGHKEKLDRVERGVDESNRKLDQLKDLLIRRERPAR